MSLDKDQAQVVQTMDTAIHQINHHPTDSVILISVILIHWIVIIYLVDSTIQHLNNQGQKTITWVRKKAIGKLGHNSPFFNTAKRNFTGAMISKTSHNQH